MFFYAVVIALYKRMVARAVSEHVFFGNTPFRYGCLMSSWIGLIKKT